MALPTSIAAFMAALMGKMSAPFLPATSSKPKRYGGLHPVDGSGQYVSPKATSKRRLHAQGRRRAGEI